MTHPGSEPVHPLVQHPGRKRRIRNLSWLPWPPTRAFQELRLWGPFLLCLTRASYPHSYQQLSLNLMSFQSPVILLPCPVCHSLSSLGPVTLFLILFLKENRASLCDPTLIEPTGPIKNNSIYTNQSPVHSFASGDYPQASPT